MSAALSYQIHCAQHTLPTRTAQKSYDARQHPFSVEDYSDIPTYKTQCQTTNAVRVTCCLRVEASVLARDHCMFISLHLGMLLMVQKLQVRLTVPPAEHIWKSCTCCRRSAWSQTQNVEMITSWVSQDATYWQQHVHK